jgi:NAD(P)-dependent dehydrogenase (short-subunit alcohol dehydrogenase family)
MSDKTILITGCSSGIGECVAQGLRARGWRVFAAARKLADVARLQAAGFDSLTLDLDDSASIQTAVTTLLSQTGERLTALFNNAAYGQPGAVEDISREALRRQFETNLFGTHELTNLLIPVMRQQRQGRIIYTSSVLGLVAFPYRGAYVATKFALEGLADTLRLELSGSGITISLIEPGPIRTRFRDNAYSAYQQHIRLDGSAHEQNYAALEGRLHQKRAATPFSLPPEAVLKRVIHALESPRPRARYYVTAPTYLFGFLRRVLPTRALDAILRRAGGDGRR